MGDFLKNHGEWLGEVWLPQPNRQNTGQSIWCGVNKQEISTGNWYNNTKQKEGISLRKNVRS